MEKRMSEVDSALGWIARALTDGNKLNESECIGVAVILEGLQVRLKNEGMI